MAFERQQQEAMHLLHPIVVWFEEEYSHRDFDAAYFIALVVEKAEPGDPSRAQLACLRFRKTPKAIESTVDRQL